VPFGLRHLVLVAGRAPAMLRAAMPAQMRRLAENGIA